MNIGTLFRAFDALVMFRDAARRLKGDPPRADTSLAQTTAPVLPGQLEARLTGVVVAALKEAFDRDHARLEMERAQLEEERRRADAAMRLEMARQALDRELARLRLLAGTALIGWIASVMLLVMRAGQTTTVSRVLLAAGWLLLLGALGAAFSAQGRLSAAIADVNRQLNADPAGTVSLWLLVAGLALAAISLLF